MTALPTSLALTDIPTGANVNSAPHHNNYAAVQTAVNGLISALSGGTAGQLLSALSSSSVGYVGAYAAYTPAWTGVGSNPVIGNGAISGRYIQLGKLVRGYIVLNVGSTTTFGSGVYLFSLPTAASAAVILNSSVGTAVLVESSQLYTMTAVVVSATTVQLVSAASPGVAVTPTSPATLASGDHVYVEFAYEAV